MVRQARMADGRPKQPVRPERPSLGNKIVYRETYKTTQSKEVLKQLKLRVGGDLRHLNMEEHAHLFTGEQAPFAFQFDLGSGHINIIHKDAGYIEALSEYRQKMLQYVDLEARYQQDLIQYEQRLAQERIRNVSREVELLNNELRGQEHLVRREEVQEKK